MPRLIIFYLLMSSYIVANAQQPYVSKVWVADNGDGTYKNPVINADYSDPDAIRVGDNFYLIASSFDAVPGLPILHSKDLVNWSIIGHALKRQPPYNVFSKTQHGNGVWAPAIRYYNSEFYIYYPDPDFGIYVTKAKHITGPWSDPILVEGGAGLIDPCPLWDDDGKVYLVHAYAGSRAGIKSVIVVKEMNAAGTKTIDEGVLVFDGHEADPTLEGPKFYKRNGYYYIFAPAGGVATGWQLVLRSKNVYGPYERKVVMAQGKTPVNGPHQGAWVNTQSGQDWFLHFQDKGAIGRVVHLQPMKWINDWPVIGVNERNGTGQPVLQYIKPDVGKTYTIETPIESDEFNTRPLGLQWQWQANPKATWYYTNTAAGTLRMYAQSIVDETKNLWDVPSVLLQKFPADAFTATAKIKFTPSEKVIGEKAGFTTMALNYSNIAITKKKDGFYIVHTVCHAAEKGTAEVEKEITKVANGEVYFRIQFTADSSYWFSYSTDGKKFIHAGDKMKAVPGKWIGIKMGLFITSPTKINDAGFMDIDWWRVDK